MSNLLGLHLFRSRRTSCLVVLLLLWAAEASAGYRISLLPFEGDRPRPLRWRVASVLKRAGHVVIGYAPPADRRSAASLRAYAERRRVDLYVMGSSEATPRGWELALRFRGPDGKPVSKPLTFRANSLLGLIRELKSEGPTRLDRAVRGGSSSAPSALAELPPGRALPLPTRRSRPQPAKSDRPVLPGAEPEAEVAEQEAAPRRSRSRGSRSVGSHSRGRADPAATRKERQRLALQRLALGASSSPREVDLDADTRSALEEDPQSRPRAISLDEEASESKPKPSPLDEEEGNEPKAIALDEPEAPAAEAASELTPEADLADAEPVPIDMDAGEPEPEPAPKAKSRKKGTLFAGRLSRKPTATAVAERGTESSEERSSETSVEDRGSDEAGAAPVARGTPNVDVGVRAGFMHRSLEYSSDLYNRLRAPTTNGWVYQLAAAVHPFARPLKERFSIIARYEGALAGTVYDDRSDSDFGVAFSEIAGGLRFRQPLGNHELGIQSTVGKLSAGLDDSSAVTGVPEISYLLLSPGVDATLNFGSASLRAGLSYQRSVGGFGEIASSEWFPRLDGYGVEGQLGLEYRLSPSVALQASGMLRRFVLEMNSRPEDAIGGEAEVAGGAVDQYLSGYFGLQFSL